MFRVSKANEIFEGSFPRVCGDVPHFSLRLAGNFRFSPRMRGCSLIHPHLKMWCDAFPAYAGMFLTPPSYRIYIPRFPRVCGDVPSYRKYSRIIPTFSPRMRGCSYGADPDLWTDLVFPAYAGMFRSSPMSNGPSLSFPRVCGDVPSPAAMVVWTPKFSPRMRGCSGRRASGRRPQAVFPAYAGMFRGIMSAQPTPACFPRVCGDVPAHQAQPEGVHPFSPHTRGCSLMPNSVWRFARVFPAYAGMFRSG